MRVGCCQTWACCRICEVHQLHLSFEQSNAGARRKPSRVRGRSGSTLRTWDGFVELARLESSGRTGLVAVVGR